MREENEILSKGFILGIKLSTLYLIIFISSFILAPDEIKPKIAVFSVIFGLCLFFGVILHGLVKKLGSRKK